MAQRKSSRRSSSPTRDYPRTVRLNALVREILADEMERIDDERFALLTVISVDVESDMRRAVVYYDHLDGADGDEEAMAALGEWRVRLQAAIGRQARTKRVPELSFKPDQSIRHGAKIDAILSGLHPTGAADVAAPDTPVATEATGAAEVTGATDATDATDATGDEHDPDGQDDGATR
jgi:ribosome-binding factor A